MMIRMMPPLGLESWPPNHSESLPITPAARDEEPIGLKDGEPTPPRDNPQIKVLGVSQAP